MKAFQVKGEFKEGRKMQDFTKEVAAEDEASAKEKILSTMGSKHKVKRWEIEISSVVELKNEDVTDPTVKYQVGA